MYTCVYCRKQSERRFPREHVIPQSFGKFKGALTLRCVCGDCNRYFANNLELFLGRDSHESFRRLQYAMKPMSEAGELRGTRVTATIAPGNSWSGARVVFGYDEQQRKLVVIPLPQVGFQAFDGSWIWFMESELTGPEAVAIPFSALAKKRLIRVEAGGRRFDVRWRPGVASALDSGQIASGRDVGAATVLENGKPVAFDEPFWFAVAAFRPDVRIVTS